MKIELSAETITAKEEFNALIDEIIVPYADQYDREECMPEDVIEKIAQEGYLGAVVPEEYGGSGMDPVTFGLLCEAVGRGSASLLSILTVHGMVSQALSKWGNPEQRAFWLPKLAVGERLAAFGLTEPNVGSDAKNIETTAVLDNDTYIVNGKKKWISFGQVADLFLIFTQLNEHPTAFLVERSQPGFSTTPITGMMGFRSAMLAELTLENCRIPSKNLVGREGFGFSHVAGTALDHGRYCIGWGSVGMAQACLEACLSYTARRKQGSVYLRDHQLIQEMIADMITNIKAAKLLCYKAGYLKEVGDPESILETTIAKYFASKIVNKIAADAIQIHGANGCSSEFPLQRYMRDAKIMEIIEGSNQIQQIIISRDAYRG